MCEYCQKEKLFDVDNKDFLMCVDEDGAFRAFWKDPDEPNHFASAEAKFRSCPMCGMKFGLQNTQRERKATDIKDFKAGQTVFIKVLKSGSRWLQGEAPTEEWKVISVGRKYIKASRDGASYCAVTFEQKQAGDRFVNKTIYSPDYVLYASREEIEEELEKERLYHEISNGFSFSKAQKISLAGLREIKKIMEGEES